MNDIEQPAHGSQPQLPIRAEEDILCSLSPDRQMEVLACARRLLERSAAVEPHVTADLEITSANSGGSLEGLEHRFKSVESLVRKIATRAWNDPSLKVSNIEQGISDTLRYTITYELPEYSEGFDKALCELRDMGYTLTKFKNYWTSGDCYRGINSVIVTKGSEVFELQCHTPESYRIKEDILHPLYEEARVLEAEALHERGRRLGQIKKRMAHLEDEMRKTVETISVPPNLELLDRWI